MTATQQFHHALLRPAVIQILRAVGFHSAKPTAVDALTDIAARYLTLLASTAVCHASLNHHDCVPDLTDIRLALTDCGLLSPASAASDEVWRELLRDPVCQIPERNGVRRFELSKRDEEDTQDVADFTGWFNGSANKEIKRIAGLLPDSRRNVMIDTSGDVQDYLTALKKKHSKTGQESKFQGTVLGISAEYRPLRIEGGPDSLSECLRLVKRFDSSRSVNAIQSAMMPFTLPALNLHVCDDVEMIDS